MNTRKTIHKKKRSLKKSSLKSTMRKPKNISRKVGAEPMRTTVANLPKNKNKSHIVRVFLEMLNMIKLYHWKTYSYSQHKATDELYSKMQDNVDRFVEVLLGKDNNRIQMLEKRIDLLDMQTKESFKKRLFTYRKFLIDMNIYFDESHDSDLLNIRDELLADLNQFLYLFSFKEI